LVIVKTQFQIWCLTLPLTTLIHTYTFTITRASFHFLAHRECRNLPETLKPVPTVF